MSRTYETPFGKFPSVTTVLGLKDKSGPLMGWAVKMGAEATREYLQGCQDRGETIDLDNVTNLIKNAFRSKQDTALDIGSNVHNAIEVFTKAPSVEVGMKLVHASPDFQQIEQPFGAFLKWHDSVGFKLVEGEHQVWSATHRFAGTLDVIAHINGKLTLGDYKSSNAIRSDYLWQVAAYYEAYKEMSGKDVDGWGCLRLDKVTGEPEWKEWERDEVDLGFKKFKCLNDLWWLEHPIKPKKGGK